MLEGGGAEMFGSLSKKEIQALVDKGCPNFFRKAVNSGKRLCAYLQLNEGDVCNVCLLRGSCERAFYLLKHFEATARTVDIVRILGITHVLYSFLDVGLAMSKIYSWRKWEIQAPYVNSNLQD